ncbi:cyanophycinase [Flavobacterium album]|uniref:Cyanophycinase n=1 Tax=Flavobacterium album TaxID=2175091 RepID=A0A2S1R1X0_9FLAO|nr:cyanophycinase [Flavobacterium album]AWH86579.1 cyanophycinase [Flavobacterium album]
MGKGKLIIIGGAENKGDDSKKNYTFDSDANVEIYNENGILKRIVDESAKKEKSRIEILSTASTEKSIGKDYVQAFGRLGVTNTGVIDINEREEARDAGLLKRLKEADVVMVTGGDQMRLTSLLGGTPFLELLLEKYNTDSNFIYAGSSAGAAAASNNMVFQGTSEDALYKGKVRITSGLALISDVIIDTHFVKRGRIGRLFQAVVANPRLLGIGLEENTALLISGNVMEAIGPGMTILVDGRGIADSNFNNIDDGEAISIENITVHVMSKYDRYDLKKHKLKIDHQNNG